MLVATASIAVATELPGYETTERVLPMTTDGVVGELVSSVRTNEPGSHVLLVTIKTQSHLWGSFTNAVFEAKYREFKIPAIPKGMSVSFANYTGSGIEWEAKTNMAYVCFLSQQTNGFSLLRLEPAEHATKVLSLYEELRKKDFQAPQELGRAVAACLISNDLVSVKTRFTQPDAFFQKEVTNSWRQVREEVELRRIPWNKVELKGVEIKKLATHGTSRVADIIMVFKVADDEFRIMLDEAYERDGRWYVLDFDWLGITHLDFTSRGAGTP